MHSMYFRRNLCVALKNSLAYMTFITLFQLRFMILWLPSSLLPIVCINYSGSVKGTSSIKKTPIESRFPLYQYLSLGFIQELNLHDFPWIRVVFKYYFGHGYLLCWYFFPILMTGSHLETKQDYKNM